MTWARFDDASWDHPKMLQAEQEVGDAAWTMWSKAIVWANQKGTKGHVPEIQIGRFTQHREPKKIAAALVRCGLFEQREGGYQIHDFEHYNPNRSETEEQRAARRDREREKKRRQRGGGTPPDTPRVPPSVPAGTTQGTPPGTHDASPPGTTAGTEVTSQPGHGLCPHEDLARAPAAPRLRGRVPGPGSHTHTGARVREGSERLTPIEAGILEELEAHEQLEAVATVEHARALACTAVGAGKSEAAARQALRDVVREANKANGRGHPLAVEAIEDIAHRYVQKAKGVPTGSGRPTGAGGGGDGHGGPSSPLGDPSPEELAAGGSPL